MQDNAVILLFVFFVATASLTTAEKATICRTYQLQSLDDVPKCIRQTVLVEKVQTPCCQPAKVDEDVLKAIVNKTVKGKKC